MSQAMDSDTTGQQQLGFLTQSKHDNQGERTLVQSGHSSPPVRITLGMQLSLLCKQHLQAHCEQVGQGVAVGAPS